MRLILVDAGKASEWRTGTNHKEWTEHPLRVICRLLISLIALKLCRSRDRMKAHGHCSAVICFSRVAVRFFASAASTSKLNRVVSAHSASPRSAWWCRPPLDQKPAEMCRCLRRRRVKQFVIACLLLGLRDTSDLRRLTIVLYTTHRLAPSSSSSTPPPACKKKHRRRRRLADLTSGGQWMT